MANPISEIYHVGDFVYFEQSSTCPFDIGKIDEMNKEEDESVTVKLQVFLRKRDISPQVVQSNDKQLFNADEFCTCSNSVLTVEEKHLLCHRELFQTKVLHQMKASQLRGKIKVMLLTEIIGARFYLDTSDAFFYEFVYDDNMKNFTSDKASIRVGEKFQAVIKDAAECDVIGDDQIKTYLAGLETEKWNQNNICSSQDIDMFVTAVKSVGTLARAMDPKSSIRHCSLNHSVAAASRDVTVQKAYDILHDHDYSVVDALKYLTVKKSSPLMFRDEFERWSVNECNIFESGIEKNGKDFHYINREFLPWKGIKNLVEYYYMWKTSSRYNAQRKTFAASKERKVKEIFIPRYSRANPALIIQSKKDAETMDYECGSCQVKECNEWYSFGPVHLKSRICSNCWVYWRKYGGLKSACRLERQGHTFLSRSLYKCTGDNCYDEFKCQSELASHQSKVHGINFVDVACLSTCKSEVPATQNGYTIKEFYKAHGTFYMRPYDWIRNLRKRSRSVLIHMARGAYFSSDKYSNIVKNLPQFLINVQIHNKNNNLDELDNLADIKATDMSIDYVSNKLTQNRAPTLVEICFNDAPLLGRSVYSKAGNFYYACDKYDRHKRTIVGRMNILRLARRPCKRTFS